MVENPTLNEELKAKLRNIRVFALDVDGVLTDGGMYYSASGDELRKFNARDGIGFVMLHKEGYIPVLVSHGETPIVNRRAEKLKIEHIYQGVRDKSTALDGLLARLKLDYSQVLFMGDDVTDIELLKKAGFAVTVPMAVDRVKGHVDYTTVRPGGNGAVREVIELLFEACELDTVP